MPGADLVQPATHNRQHSAYLPWPRPEMHSCDRLGDLHTCLYSCQATERERAAPRAGGRVRAICWVELAWRADCYFIRMGKLTESNETAVLLSQIYSCYKIASAVQRHAAKLFKISISTDFWRSLNLSLLKQGREMKCCHPCFKNLWGFLTGRCWSSVGN